MTIAQRKIELINWITNLSNESSISKVEELMNEIGDIPSELIDILKASENTPDSELIEHTSVKDFRRIH